MSGASDDNFNLVVNIPPSLAEEVDAIKAHISTLEDNPNVRAAQAIEDALKLRALIARQNINPNDLPSIMSLWQQMKTLATGGNFTYIVLESDGNLGPVRRSQFVIPIPSLLLGNTPEK